jgi:RNA polymerase sigma-70 factor (ECF subfamily)
MPPVPVYINEEGEEVSVFNSLASDQDVEALNHEQAKFKRSIRNLISELPSDQREVVLMRTYYEMSFKEIAEFTNVSINTSLGRMRYALFNLKKMIEERKLELAVR